MNRKTHFVFTLFLILFLSWADVYFIGTNGILIMPILVRQSIHFFVFLLTMYIGYVFWKKYAEKWVCQLWVFCYLFILFLILITGIFWIMNIKNNYLQNVILLLRNSFIQPLPFLFFYVLDIISLLKLKKQ